MERFYRDFLHFTESNHLIHQEDKILVAVSGGVDSMVLLNLFSRTDWPFGVAHCNFNLRGQESDKDETLVIDYCKANSIHFDVKSFDTKSYATENGQSIQMAARDLRYQWFRELMDKYAYSKLATAHHSDDNLETILFNLTKGTGIMGLAGIPLKEKRIIRPLLFATREDILRYAHGQGIQWREDHSNEDTRYVRSKIRKEIIPMLEEINPSLKNKFGRTAERIRQGKDIARVYIKEQLSEILFHDGNLLKINKSRLVQATGSSTILYEALKGYGFNYEMCSGIIESVETTGAIFITATHELNIDRDYLLIKSRNELNVTAIQLDRKAQGFMVDGQYFNIEFRGKEDFELSSDPAVACLDADLVKFPLMVRQWQEGDRFRPLGMHGTKKISDFLVDEKVPVIEKERVMVLESAGEIVWLVGFRISDDYRVTDNTTEFMNISPA